MDDDQSDTVPEGALLSIANNILSLLEYSSELENEEDLFLDDFYIAIVSNLVSDRKFNIVPGKTKAEKVKSLDALIQFLSQIIEMDFSQISAKGIIEEHDRVSAKCLLELIEELIKALIEQNGEEEQSEKGGHSISEEMKRPNISDGNMDRGINQFDDDENNEEMHNETSELNMNEKNSEDDIIKVHESNNSNENEDNMLHSHSQISHEIDNIDESNKEIQLSTPNINKTDNLENNTEHNLTTNNNNISNNNEIPQNESSEIYIGNRSCLEPLDIEKIMRMNQDESYMRHTMTQNDISRYAREYAEAEEEEANDEEGAHNEEDMKYAPLEVLEVSQNNNLEETPIKNVSHISEVSKSKENSEQQHILSKKRSDLPSNEMSNKEVNIDKISSNIDKDITGSYVSYKKEDSEEKEQRFGEDEMDDEYFNQSNSIRSAAMPQQRQRIDLSSSKNSLNSYNNNNEDLSVSKPEHEDMDNTQSEKKSNHNISKTSSLKNNSNKSNKSKKKSNNNISQSDISKSSIHTNPNNNNKSEVKNTKSSSSSILEELPLSNEELQYEIMKELHRLYGNKLDRVLLNYNAQNSQSVIDLIIRNIKLARQKTMKIANRIPDPDDLVTKEFIHRYNKELQYILKYYKKEKMQRNAFQERALRTITQNVKVMKKIQEIQTKKIESEIEQKRKAREVRNHHNQLRMCNEIYAKAFQFEKEKYIEETANQMELRRIENEEKRKAMMEIEKYYKDKIAILQELLRREKRDREIEHRAKIQFLSQLERERKGEFRRQIDEVLERFDEEDKKAELNDNNQEEIEKIFNLYYKK